MQVQCNGCVLARKMGKLKVWCERHIKLDYLSDRVTNLVNEGDSRNVMDLELGKALIILHDNLLHEILLENIDSNFL